MVTDGTGRLSVFIEFRKMDDIDMDSLITLVENKPALWDKTQQCYKRRHSTFAAWKEVCLKLNEDFEQLSDEEKNDFGKEVIKKWNNARDNWMKHHKKVKECKQSGVKIPRKYKYYDQMSFLSKLSISEDQRQASENLSQSQSSDLEANNESCVRNNSTVTEISRKRKKDASEYDRQTLPSTKSTGFEDKSMSFFKSIAPIVDKYNDEDYIEFQYEVIKVIRKFTTRHQTLLQQNYNAVSTSNLHQVLIPTESIASTFSTPVEFQPKKQPKDSDSE